MKLNRIIILIIITLLVLPVASFASETNGTINSVNKYAWSNQVGWINFKTTNGDIKISDSGITGYAWNSNYGWINMAPTSSGVKVAASGSLSGYAWGTNIGWVNFSGVSINSSGKFVGSASGKIIGTLTFDCNNCNVSTDYRPKDFRVVTPTPTNVAASSNGYAPITIHTPQQTPIVTILPKPTSTKVVLSTHVHGEKKVAYGISASSNKNALNNISAKVLPEQLFDIRLSLDNSPAAKSEYIISRVTFASFNKAPTQVNMLFSITDKNGNILWKKDATTTVQTEAVYVKHLPVLNLPVGEYTLKLHTSYNKTVEDNFSARFQIISENKSFNWFTWSIGILTSLILLIIIIIFVRNKMIRNSVTEGLKIT